MPDREKLNHLAEQLQLSPEQHMLLAIAQNRAHEEAIGLQQQLLDSLNNRIASHERDCARQHEQNGREFGEIKRRLDMGAERFERMSEEGAERFEATRALFDSGVAALSTDMKAMAAGIDGRLQKLEGRAPINDMMSRWVHQGITAAAGAAICFVWLKATGVVG